MIWEEIQRQFETLEFKNRSKQSKKARSCVDLHTGDSHRYAPSTHGEGGRECRWVFAHDHGRPHARSNQRPMGKKVAGERERERRANAYTTLAPWRRRYRSSQDLHHGRSYVLPLDVTEKIDQLVSMTIALHADVTIMPESISTMQVTIGVPTTATKRGTLP